MNTQRNTFGNLYPTIKQEYSSPLSGMRDVALEHLRIGDEVVWLPEGKAVSIHKLDIGKVHRTLYYVDESNREAFLAIVDFHDFVEGSNHEINSRGLPCFRRAVPIKHLKKLGEFLENMNTQQRNNYSDQNNNFSKPLHKDTNPFRNPANLSKAYVLRPCMLSMKNQTKHPLISESDPIFIFNQKSVVKGMVKRLLTCDQLFYIGAEFASAVYSHELEHSVFCPFQTNGCERRVAINVIALSKVIWDTEFRLIVKNTKQATFEDLFGFREESYEPPPSYSAAINGQQFPRISNLPSAPPYYDTSPINQKPSEVFEPQQTLSKAYSIDNHEKNTPIQKKPIPQQSLLVQELRSKLKISPKSPELLDKPTTSESKSIATEETLPLNSNPKINSIVEELKRRQNGTGNKHQRPTSTPVLFNNNATSGESPLKSQVAQKSTPNRLSLQPTTSASHTTPTRPQSGNMKPPRPISTGNGNFFKSMDVSNTLSPKPPLLPKPNIVPGTKFSFKPDQKPISVNTLTKPEESLEKPVEPVASFLYKEYTPPQVSNIPDAPQFPVQVKEGVNSGKEIQPLPQRLPPKEEIQVKLPEIVQVASLPKVSRMNLPPPPPPPTNPEPSISTTQNETGESSSGRSSVSSDRSSLLEQIRQGINLRRVDDNEEDRPKSSDISSPEGIESIIKGAIEVRRAMLSDSENDDENDEDSDAWD